MSSLIQNPHDRFFRSSMANPRMALEFLQHHLPDHIAELVDFNSLKLMPGSFLDEAMKQWMTDILYSVNFSGKPGYIYLLIEHQRNADALMPLRLLEYSINICRTHLREYQTLKLPLVYPCVIYNGEERYEYTTDLFELFHDSDLAREFFLKPFQLIDLSQIADDDLKKKPLLGMLEMFLKHAFTRDAVALINSLSEIIRGVEAKNEIELLKLGFNYLLKTQQFKESILATFEETLSEKNKSNIMTIAESLIEEGIQKGIQQGMQQFRSSLLRQLGRRFPNQITSNHLELIEDADSESLSLWSEKLMDATCIAEVFAW